MAKTEFFELRGRGYNILTQKPNTWGKFQADLILRDPNEIKEAEKLSDRFGLKLHNEVYAPGGNIKNVTAVKLSRKMVTEGKYPCTSIPTVDANTGAEIRDLISNDADVTYRFKVWEYPGGTDKRGNNFPGGNSFQLERVLVHEYTPYKSA